MNCGFTVEMCLGWRERGRRERERKREWERQTNKEQEVRTVNRLFSKSFRKKEKYGCFNT